MAVLFLSLRRGQGEGSRKEPFFMDLAAASRARHGWAGSTNIPAAGLPSTRHRGHTGTAGTARDGHAAAGSTAKHV